MTYKRVKFYNRSLSDVMVEIAGVMVTIAGKTISSIYQLESSVLENIESNNQDLSTMVVEVINSDGPIFSSITVDTATIGDVTNDEIQDLDGATSEIQSQLNGKEPTITAGTSSQYLRGDKTFQTLDKNAVGLDNVDDTSDVNKPISTAQQTALDKKIDLIASVDSIDAKVAAVTPLFTVPTGKKLVITEINVRVIAADTVTVSPTLGVGIAAGEDDIMPSTLLSNLDVLDEVFKYETEGTFKIGKPADVVKLGIDTGATAITMTIGVDLLGYFK
jgi:hypothetical protein